jgi:antitoxin component YwqK of YwqJK toxin-antitoxin module
MKKINTFGIGSFTILLILVVMGIPLWVYFFGDGSLPSIKYLFFSLILFGGILLVIISNLNQVVEFYNSLVEVDDKSKQSEEKEEIVKVEQIELFHDNGYLKLVGTYLDGKKDGDWKFYDNYGDLCVTGKYKNGKRDGIWVEYHGYNQKIHFKLSYQDGKIIDSIFESYHDNGEIETRGFYKDGKQHGEWISWYSDGKVRVTGSFKNGKQSGYFFKNGKNISLRLDVFFKSPRDFTFKKYSNGDKGIVLLEGEICNGLRHGDWKKYDEIGNLNEVKNFTFGIEDPVDFWSEREKFDWSEFITREFKFINSSFKDDSHWYGKLL